MTDDLQELDINFLGDIVGAGQSEEEEEEVEEEEVSEEDEELEEEPGFEGPANWAEVDTVELDRVMLHVTSAAMPSTDNKETATRLAMHAAALEADNSDPLGLGRIDPRQLILVQAEEAKKAWRMGRMAASTRRSTRRDTAEQDAIAQAAATGASRRHSLVNASTLHELRPKVLPTSEHFEPGIFLGAIHANTSMADLLKGRQNLKKELSERTAQLKALVKENFDRFISCKNTIDDIHKRLRKSEAHDSLSASGSSTSDMVVAISEVQEEAKSAFADLLERAANSDQVRSVLALLKRYEGLFQLPSRIRQSTQQGDYDQVMSEYKKARSLMGSMGAPDTKSVWHKLFTEVEKGISDVARRLDAVLRDPATPQAVALDAMRHVLQLQAERAESTAGMEPVMLYVKAREKLLRKELEDCTEWHKANLQTLREQKRGHGPPWKSRQEGQAQSDAVLAQAVALCDHGNAVMQAAPGHMDPPSASPWQAENEATAWLGFVKELVHIVTKSLPDFWHVPQDKLNQLKAVPAALETVQEGVQTGLVIARDILQSFTNKLHLALKELVKEEHNRSSFLAALREVVTGFVAFGTTSTPQFVPDSLQSLLETASSLAINQMIARQKHVTDQMARQENFEIIASSHKAGHPASKLPGMLREVVASGMAQLEAVVEEGSRADTNNSAFNPIGKHASHLRHAFCECFTNYAVATDQLWASVSTKGDTSARTGLSADTKLLVLHSNCVHVRTHVLKDLSTRYNNLLSIDGGGQEGRELLAECAEDIRAVEARLAGIYIEARINLLNDMLDEYFDDDGTDWPSAPLPQGLRDCAHEIVNTLVAVQAEVYGNALSLQRRVMDELLQHLFAAYNTCLSDKREDLNPGGALQLLMELQYFGLALGPVLRSPRDQLLAQAKASLLQVIDELAEEEGSPAEEEFEAWCETIQGGNMGGRAELICNFRTTDLIKATRFNVASFKA